MDQMSIDSDYNFNDLSLIKGHTKIKTLKTAKNHFSKYLKHESNKDLTFQCWDDVPADSAVGNILGIFSDYIVKM